MVPTVVDSTVTALGDAVDMATTELVHDQLVALSPDELVELLQRVETLRNQLLQVDLELAAACETVGVADHLAIPSTAVMLARVTRIEPSEAKARVAAAVALRTSRTATGEALPATRPELATAVRAGEVNASQVSCALATLDRIEHHGASADQIAHAEQTLIAHARLFDPREFRRIARHLVECFDPDGVLTDEAGHEARRRVQLHRAKDGSWRLEGHLTPSLGQQWATILDPLTRRQDDPATPDLRTVEERRHDALADIAGRLLRAGGLPDTGGAPATVIITVDHATLATGKGSGAFADGSPVSVRAIAELADQADILTVVRDSRTGAVLSAGRTRRLASLTQTLALHARDKGCSFPGCHRTPEWCQRHHVISWIDGGPTDLDNLTLVCHYHHHNFARLGWSCAIVDGLPTWTPPRHIDPARTPMVHHRIRPPDPLRPMANIPIQTQLLI